MKWITLMVLLVILPVQLSGCSGLKEKVSEATYEVNQNLKNLKNLNPPDSTQTTPNPPETLVIESTSSPASGAPTAKKMELLTNSTVLISPEFCGDEIRWRYVVENAIFCAINQNELLNLSSFAQELRRDDIRNSVWNILEWENATIGYDWEKASLPAPEIVYWSDGRVEVVKGKENVIQTPTETIKRRKGICSDYAILTIALLLEMGYQPVYLFDIKFENNPVGHTTAAIKIDEEYYPIDQLVPVLDLGSYYEKWAEHQDFGRIGNKKISTITVYRVKVIEVGNGKRIEVVNLGNLTAEEIKQFDHAVTEKDLEAISSSIIALVEKNFAIRREPNLNDLDRMKYMPPGYRDGGSWKIQLSYFADYYNPVFHKQFSEYVFKQMLKAEIVKDLRKSNRFWVKVEKKGGDLVVKLYFAKRI